MEKFMGTRPTASVEVIRDGKIVMMEIPLDEITKDVKYAYSRGQCDELALAIHELKKWPMVAIFTAAKIKLPKEWDAEWDGRTVAELRAAYPKTWMNANRHTLVRTPNGGLLDIRGVKTHEYWRKEFDGSCAFLEITPKDIADSLTVLKAHQPSNMDVARKIAPLVLKSYPI